ncbi:MAG: 1-(5-phosphoribosyl)-5-[(5-phosphoribosylamino)methylideneamino]imidazole-4-carboxamide isomerase [Nitrospirota bacterium]
MIIIPAIDLKDGKCVRLLQGKMEESTIYSDNPSEIAKGWQDAGAELIHVVDLDGAFAGEMKNLESIISIRQSVNIPIEVGGGIRDTTTVNRLFSLRIDRVVLGTIAIESPEFLSELCGRFPGRILVGIDARDGWVAIKGWSETTKKKATDLAREIESCGVAAIIYTDIKRDGMLSGPNIKAIREMAESVNIPVIASGGVSDINDIKRLMQLPIEGVVVGKAIYSGSLDLREAIELTKSFQSHS